MDAWLVTSNQVDVGRQGFRKKGPCAKGSEQGRGRLVEKLGQVWGVMEHRVTEQRWLVSHRSHPAEGHPRKVCGLGNVPFSGSVCFLAYCPLLRVPLPISTLLPLYLILQFISFFLFLFLNILY